MNLLNFFSFSLLPLWIFTYFELRIALKCKKPVKFMFFSSLYLAEFDTIRTRFQLQHSLNIIFKSSPSVQCGRIFGPLAPDTEFASNLVCVGVVHPPLLQCRDHQRNPPVPQYLPRQRIPPHHALPYTDLFQQSRQGEGDTAWLA
jgi:hypothetical protein